MLAHCQAARWFAMVGPSAGCLPDALFSRGVTLLGGSWVEDRAAFIDGLTSGDKDKRKGRQSTSKFALTPVAYPGVDVLIGRLSERRT
jgi:uncharacterized protein (DUF4213/DUF364 family)